MKKDSRIEFLQHVWLFERCSRTELATIASVTTQVGVAAGEVLAHEGDTGREFYVILEGEAEATRNGIPVAMLGPGSFFGEMSLLDRLPRSATITTCGPCELLVLTQQAFTAIISTMPSVDRKMLAVLASRLRDLEDRFLPEEQYEPSRVSDRASSRTSS
jgi:CRP-like cAMP-binding protein